jgi:uncharacterized RmlC-like cupin family protein
LNHKPNTPESTRPARTEIHVNSTSVPILIFLDHPELSGLEDNAPTMTTTQPVTDRGLRVIRPDNRCAEACSGAMLREGGIAEQTVGAQKIWLGYVELGPGLVSAVHHHGEAESGIYIISGHAQFFSGEELVDGQEAHAGDFVWVPPHLVHLEMNMSRDEPVRMVVARSTQAALTFNLPTPEGWQAPAI